MQKFLKKFLMHRSFRLKLCKIKLNYTSLNKNACRYAINLKGIYLEQEKCQDIHYKLFHYNYFAICIDERNNLK